MYETKIKNALWWAFDIPGNIGWILYFIGCGKYLARNGLSENILTSVLLIVPALLMLTGIAELISERIHKLDRVLPKVRYFRGFGALTLGGLLGAVFSAVTISGNTSNGNGILMLTGGLMCFVFAGLIMVSFRKRSDS